MIAGKRLFSVLTVLGFLLSNLAGVKLFSMSNQWLWIPVWDMNVSYAFAISILFLTGFSAVVAAILLRTSLAILTIGLFLSYVLFVDVNLLQPYNYMYLFLLFLFCADKERTSIAVSILPYLLAGIYVWSGLHKFNAHYAESAFYNTFYQLFHLPSYWAESRWPLLAYFSAFLEVLFGAGLLFRAFRKYAALLLIATHVIILLAIGPFGLQWNPTVWPWNLFMMAILSSFILETKHELVVWNWRTIVPMAMIWLLPIATMLHLAPRSCGWHLYSADDPYGYVCLKDKPSDEVGTACVQTDAAWRFYVNLFYIQQTNTMAVPEPWILERLFEKMEAVIPELSGTEMRFGVYYDEWSCD
ncbi:MAG: DoxX family membrane protein [Flavobacteriales bacterium]|nr:DoxX family membrane protein [Flavobacteriales bacterium]